MINLDTEALISRLAASEQLAMKEIFHHFFPLVFKKIFVIVRQKELSEDLAQEVFLKIWRKREKLEIQQSLEGYLAKMAYHEALAHLRKKTTEVQAVENEQLENVMMSDGHLEIESMELQDRIELIIKGLPPRCRGVFMLSRYEGKSYKEIGDLMNISVKTVENQMGKALGILRHELQDLLIIFLLSLIWV
ncbi:MAG: RNA polymerase sigma-70 factor [Saprospiraceae bacterium]|nr:RNA polymerase sigma-70 factor [Saprospiraceae bacterium]